MRHTPIPLVIALALAAAWPARAQTLQDLISGKNVPLTLKLGNLNGDWRRMTVAGQVDTGGMMQMCASMLGGTAGGPYYTKGQMVTLGSETYIITYRAPLPPIDCAALMRAGVASGPPAPPRLTSDTPLSLSLLNLRTSGSLIDIRSFDLQQELAQPEPPAPAAAQGSMPGG